MAEKKNKFPQNVPGAFYVDHDCISCDACTLAAPEHFVMNEEEDHAYVKVQPQTEKEKEACKEALEACPVEAIGNDGEKS